MSLARGFGSNVQIKFNMLAKQEVPDHEDGEPDDRGTRWSEVSGETNKRIIPNN